VQRRFLDAFRDATRTCRSPSARVEAVVRQFSSLVEHAPASARFWIRMSSYFPDEVGEPGRLIRIHQEYTEQLAGTLAGRALDQLEPSDVRAALIVDSACWAAALRPTRHPRTSSRSSVRYPFGT
jgi:hypothetical protein